MSKDTNKQQKEVNTMKNSFTTIIRNANGTMETRVLNLAQTIEVLRDVMNVTAEVASMTLHHMKVGKIYACLKGVRIVKNALIG